MKNLPAPPSPSPGPRDWFSAKAIRRKQMWPATILFLLSSLSFCGMIAATFVPGEASFPLVPVLSFGSVSLLLGYVSYIWYIRVTVRVVGDGEGNRFLYLQNPGGKTRKIPFPLRTVHSWWKHRQPVMLLGHLVRLRKPVLSLAIQDENGKTLLAFEEEVGHGVPIPPDWPEEERRYERGITYDCFPFPRFDLPLLKNTLDQIQAMSDRS